MFGGVQFWRGASEFAHRGGRLAEQVKDVANACGIPHAGRFSQYYKQMFGQLPRETLLAQ